MCSFLILRNGMCFLLYDDHLRTFRYIERDQVEDTCADLIALQYNIHEFGFWQVDLYILLLRDNRWLFNPWDQRFSVRFTSNQGLRLTES